MAILVTKWFGTFLVDETSGRIVGSRLMPRDPAEAAEKLACMQRGGILPEERELAAEVPKLNVLDRRQAELGRPMYYDASAIRPEDHGFDAAFMRETMMELGRLRTSEPIPSDRSLVQAIRGLDDLIVTANLFNERLHEWYGMHFPELADHARDRRYASLIAAHGNRDGIIAELGLELQSIGAELEEGDMDAVRSLAGTLEAVYDDRVRMEGYIDGLVDGLCPNLCAVVGGPLSARLISLAGGLERLASLPSSTVQLLGAEKAMFRHLRSGKRPPKHGIIYQHPAVHGAPYWQRGSISRALAGKALIAAKIDAYGGEYRGDELREGFETRVEEIRKAYPSPPKRKKKRPAGRRKGRGGSRGSGDR
jgi:nucleolar protein 56